VTAASASGAASASPITITADAGPDILVRPGTAVALSAKNNAPNIDTTALTFAWTQSSGDPVTLNKPNTATPSFIAPLQGTTNILTRSFEVTITHTSGSTSKDTVVVTTDITVKDIVVIDAYSRVNSQGGTITVSARSDLVGDPNAQMLIKVATGGFVAMTKVGTNSGKWSYSQRSTPAGAPIVVKTRIGATDFGTASKGAPFRRSVEWSA
jgi:hypothetical protein